MNALINAEVSVGATNVQHSSLQFLHSQHLIAPVRLASIYDNIIGV